MNGRRRPVAWLAVLGIVLAMGAMMYGSSRLLSSRFTRQLDDGYTTGEAEIAGPVKRLVIDWVDGKVTVERRSGSTVGIRETSEKALGDDTRVRWRLDGDTLRIRYSNGGLEITESLQKELTVSLPEDLSLAEVSVKADSAALEARELRVEDLRLETASGSIRAEGAAQRIICSAASGGIELDLEGETEKLQAETAAGAITVRAPSVRRAELKSTVGDVDVSLSDFASLQITTTSGSVTTTLPASPGYRAEVKTTAGSVRGDAALTQSGKVWTCGSGSARVSIETTSGSVRLDTGA